MTRVLLYKGCFKGCFTGLGAAGRYGSVRLRTARQRRCLSHEGGGTHNTKAVQQPRRLWKHNAKAVSYRRRRPPVGGHRPALLTIARYDHTDVLGECSKQRRTQSCMSHFESSAARAMAPHAHTPTRSTPIMWSPAAATAPTAHRDAAPCPWRGAVRSD